MHQTAAEGRGGTGDGPCGILWTASRALFQCRRLAVVVGGSTHGNVVVVVWLLGMKIVKTPMHAASTRPAHADTQTQTHRHRHTKLRSNTWVDFRARNTSTASQPIMFPWRSRLYRVGHWSRAWHSENAPISVISLHLTLNCLQGKCGHEIGCAIVCLFVCLFM